MVSGRAIALTGSDQAVFANQCIYIGFSLRETSGSAGAVVRIYDNASAASGTLLDTVSLTSGESRSEEYVRALTASAGIYVDIVSGAVEGSVRIG